MVIPIYNNNPRAPMRDHVQRSKTTYSSRNAGGAEDAEPAKVRPQSLCRRWAGGADVRYWWIFERWARSCPHSSTMLGSRSFHLRLPSAITSCRPRCVSSERLCRIWSPVWPTGGCGCIHSALGIAADDRHSQCEAMSAHYEVCILLIEFEEDKFGLRVSRTRLRQTPN